ncbi:MAG: MFS transporter [Oscillospiraceae bacterium]|nr:MFS transporter [Oscillospiraceae bacterium]
MKNLWHDLKEMRGFLLLWFTQLVSGMGSAMTAYALVIWSYTQTGSALRTALLMVCSYAPYVVCSIFAGALSDRWDKKKTMLVCDALAALSTCAVLALLETGGLRIWHLYIVNALSGLMNTFQQPASEVATSALLKREYYQKVGGLRYLSNSLNSILTPILTTAVMSLWGIGTVIAIDLCSFGVAFVVLLLFIPIPESGKKGEKESILQSAAEGVRWLKGNPGIFHLMLFLAGINLVASMFNAALPAMILSKASQTALGTVNSVTGIAMLAGSLLASLLPAPRSRVKAVWYSLMLSMCTENFFLAFGRNVWVWCFGAVLGWIALPWMSANLEAVNRLNIPMEIQGRVFAARNSFQFFTIPVGYFLGGLLVDRVFEPVMAMQAPESLAVRLFGSGKGSGAAMLFAALWLAGIAVCLIFRADKHIWRLEE